MLSLDGAIINLICFCFRPLKAVAVAGLFPVIGQGPAGLVTKEPF